MERTVLFLVLLGILALFGLVVFVQEMEEVIAQHRREHPGERILTTTNVLAFIGSVTVICAICFFLLRR